MRLKNRTWHLFIDGDLAGCFHTEKAAGSARNGSHAAADVEGKDRPVIRVLRVTDGVTADPRKGRVETD